MRYAATRTPQPATRNDRTHPPGKRVTATARECFQNSIISKSWNKSVLGRVIDNRNRNNGVTDRIIAQQDNCIFDITDFVWESIKKGRVRPADTALF
jgi:hypothetical protein